MYMVQNDLQGKSVSSVFICGSYMEVIEVINNFIYRLLTKSIITSYALLWNILFPQILYFRIVNFLLKLLDWN